MAGAQEARKALPNTAMPSCRKTRRRTDRKSTRLNSSHSQISYAVFCLKKKKNVHEDRAVADREGTGDVGHERRRQCCPADHCRLVSCSWVFAPSFPAIMSRYAACVSLY